MKLILATRNRHKLSEISSLIGDLSTAFDVMASGDLPELPDIIEDGATLQANALKKATETAAAAARYFPDTPFLVLADDTGLEVDALQGAPGIFSARFAQFDGLTPSSTLAPRAVSYAENNAKLIQLLANVPVEKRTARFRCVIAIVESVGPQHWVEGVCEGWMGPSGRGANGFGYDPIFFPKGHKQTFAELGEDQKNQISHRGLALAKARDLLKTLVNRVPMKQRKQG